MRERGIPLEVCPSINVITGIFPSLESHPLPRLLDAGLTVTLNADVPAMIATSVSDEYEHARRAFGMTDIQLAEIACNGVRAAFLEPERRVALERQIEEWLRPAEAEVIGS